MKEKLADFRIIIYNIKREYKQTLELYNNLKVEYKSCETKYENLKVKSFKDSTLVNQYKKENYTLNNENISLKDKQTLLRLEINNLVKERSSVNNLNFTLSEKYESLKQQFTSLLNSYNLKKAIDNKSLALINQMITLQVTKLEEEKENVLKLTKNRNKIDKEFKVYCKHIVESIGGKDEQIKCVKSKNEMLMKEICKLKRKNDEMIDIIGGFEKEKNLNLDKDYEMGKEVFVLKSKVMVYEKMIGVEIKENFKRRYSFL